MAKVISQKGEFPTGNFALATALITCGFPWADEAQKLRNLYTDPARPERYGKEQFLRKFGKVTFYIGRNNTQAPDLTLQDALDAYDGVTTPGAQLDSLLEGEGVVDKATVRKLVHAAYVECSKNTTANLRTIRTLPNMVPAHIKFTKPDGLPVVISENCDAATAAEWGIVGGK